MKKILAAITVAAMLGTSSMAIAQDAFPPNTYEALLQAIPTSGSSDLSGIASEDQVVIVLVSTLETGAVPPSDLENALTTNAESTASLQTNLAANAVISSALTAGGYAVEDVVAISLDNSGTTATVYVDDRM